MGVESTEVCDLSMQDLVDNCLTDDDIANFPSHAYDTRHGTYALDTHMTFDYILQHDIEPAKSYEWSGGRCKPSQKIQRSREDVKHMHSYRFVDLEMDEDFRYASTRMLLGVRMQLTWEYMEPKSGVIFNPSVKPKNENKDWHPLVITGFGFDPATGFEYAEALNSFDPNWCDQGFCNIARGPSANYEILNDCLFPIVEDTKWNRGSPA